MAHDRGFAILKDFLGERKTSSVSVVEEVSLVFLFWALFRFVLFVTIVEKRIRFFSSFFVRLISFHSLQPNGSSSCHCTSCRISEMDRIIDLISRVIG